MPETQKKNETEEEVKPIIEEKDLERPDFVFMPKGNHLWKQQGYYLVCNSCDLSHAVFIGKEKMLVGFKDGQPVLKTRKELGMK
jgi:hypothetical protein